MTATLHPGLLISREHSAAHVHRCEIRPSNQHSVETQTAEDKLNESKAALEHKTWLYERLAAGQYNDDDDLYNVDFLRKETLEDEERSLRHEAAEHGPPRALEAAVDSAAGLLSSAGEPSASKHVTCREMQFMAAF